MNVKRTREALINMGFGPEIAGDIIKHKLNERKENEKKNLLDSMTVTLGGLDGID